MFKALAAVLTVLCTAASSLPAMTAGVDHPGSLSILLSVEKVRAELKLDSLQRALLTSLRDEYKSAARKLANPMPVTAQARAAADKQLLQLNKRFNQRALSILNDDQRAKLSEIEGKFLGPTMVYTPSVQKRLGLTEQQKHQIEALRRQGVAYVGKINRKFEEGKISQQQRLELLRNQRTVQGSKILKVLTPKQRETVLAFEGKKLAG